MISPRRQANERGAGAPVTKTLTHSWYMTGRHLRNLMRQPAWIFISLVQPVVWLLLYGALFKRIVEIPGFGASSYIDFLTPGIVVMTALFSAGWSGMALIDDIDAGVIDRFLVAPTSRSSLVWGTLIQYALIGVVQSAIIIVLGFIVGAHYPGGMLGILALVAAAVLLGIGIGGFSNAIAVLTRRRETMIAASNFIILPLTFISSVFMAQALMPGWMQSVARYNPVNWAVQAGRGALVASPDWGMVGTRLLALLVFAVVLGWLATRAFRVYQRSI
jgi:ABC-2 type transport system permease protein